MGRAVTAIALLCFSAVASARTFNVINSCSETIWPALFTSSGPIPSQPAGWEAAPGFRLSFDTAENWSGRVWGRRECDFSNGSTLPTTCKTGGCNGGLVCATSGGTGVPPVTLAEFTLNASGGQDFYDVSNVDGFDLPLAITTNVGCPAPTCLADLNAGCPDPRMRVAGSSGATIGCLTACGANLDGNQANSPNCCSGSYSTPQTCPSSGVSHYSFFKSGCPDAYAYAYDESSGSAIFTCSAARSATYTIEFCANGSSANASTSASGTAAGSAVSRSASSTSSAAATSTPSPSTGAAARLSPFLRLLHWR